MLLVGLPNASGDPQDDVVKKELKAMAGTWRPVSAENNGFKVPEDGLKENRRALDAEVQVLERATGSEFEQAALAYVHGAREADAAVHDHDFTVVAQVREAKPRGDELRQEPCHPHPGLT